MPCANVSKFSTALSTSVLKIVAVLPDSDSDVLSDESLKLYFNRLIIRSGRVRGRLEFGDGLLDETPEQIEQVPDLRYNDEKKQLRQTPSNTSDSIQSNFLVFRIGSSAKLRIAHQIHC